LNQLLPQHPQQELMVFCYVPSQSFFQLGNLASQLTYG
jgi:hypothetical protein